MATRSTLRVSDQDDCFDIYRHFDGYPDGDCGVIHDIKAAMGLAWALPRFEARDFAAAVVATMKTGAGSVYLTKNADRHIDRAYHYDVRCAEQALQIVVHETSYRVNGIVPIFHGTIDEAVKHFDAESHTPQITMDEIWAALEVAESALVDIPTAKHKGYLAEARKKIFHIMDTKRGLKPVNEE